MGLLIQPNRKAVLVVEDEPLLRMMAMAMVEDAGFEPVEARDADEAIALLEARTDITIVFTDVDMPGSMDGLKLAAAIRDRWPPIEIVITSGHFRLDDSTIPARTVFFPKPYDHQEVVATLRWMAGV
ncbi:response regulator [Rhizobiales bacterium RZME27]|jgi:CheY-like chemotaxis protein|uniref:Response regulator n=1 Tax=Endobacterium cereale TaxID=2663029 RepID=A0A6A8A409_9HYPH|nr:response regulator [Endobacterium cereale]MEB2846671.1 response regulator [Endobacterium cereale]MQY44478.1 response regulator [Endobacterium cereale]